MWITDVSQRAYNAAKAQSFSGLTELTAQIAASAYKKEDGETLSVCHTLIDANWGLTTSVVKRVCKNCGTRFEPTLGWGMGPDREFFRTLRKPGELRGEGWRKPPLKECDLVRHYIYNTNLWKSKLRDRLLTSAGGAGSITFYHGDHTKLFQHLLSETSSPLTGIHGTMDKWSLIPGEPNHWWDCLTMSLVAYTTLSSSLHYNARLNIPSNAAGPAANTPIFCDLSSYCKR